MKVLFEDLQAAGVLYQKSGTIHEVRAKKEVLLSAGTVGSPKLLMLSGIGPKNHLRKHKAST